MYIWEFLSSKYVSYFRLQPALGKREQAGLGLGHELHILEALLSKLWTQSRHLLVRRLT